ncbi:MAG TPA: alpha/beta fold hydrolase [Candidatus Thermoplasmatota archaeon]|nr:alpha/beta fold hydrolase [Candidatus Thermoplasmatota archaeon]
MARPVLLVHGILGQRHLYWNILARRLADEGLEVHEAVLPSYMLGDVRMAARYLALRVREVLAISGATHVDLVCHSAGGLVAREYLARRKGARWVRTCILLGTPNQGTHLGTVLAFPFVRIAAQARPGSAFLRELNEAAVPARTKVWNLWSVFDGVVIPSELAVLPGARNVCVPTTHWGFLWSRGVHRLVADLLLGRLDSVEAAQAAADGQPPEPQQASPSGAT